MQYYVLYNDETGELNVRFHKTGCEVCLSIAKLLRSKEHEYHIRDFTVVYGKDVDVHTKVVTHVFLGAADENTNVSE